MNSRRNYNEYKKDQDAKGIHVAAIVEVQSYDEQNQTVDVLPLSKRLEQGEYTSQSMIQGVPIVPTTGGGFIVKIPYRKGDIGVVVYQDHDIDNVIIGGKESIPNTERSYAPEDAVFVGGYGKSPAGLPAGALVLATEDGSNYIALTTGGLEIKGDASIKGAVQIEGSLTVNGQPVP